MVEVDMYTGTTGQGLYRDEPVGTLLRNPLMATVQVTFSASGATATVNTSDGRSHPGVTVTGDTGDYDVAGLPRGTFYHVVGCEMLVADGTADVNRATVQRDSLDASAGTLTFQTRQGSDGAETDPANGDIVHMTIWVDTIPVPL